MKIIEIEVYVSTKLMGSEIRGTITVEIDDDFNDDETEAELEYEAKQWMFEQIEWGWKRI